MISRQPFFIPSVLLVALAAPLALGLVPPNRFYGVRTPRTLSDAGLWRRANRAGGLYLGAAGAVYLLAAAATPTADGRDLKLWLTHLAAFAGPLAAALLALRGSLRRL